MASALNFTRDSNGNIVSINTFKDDTKPFRIRVKLNSAYQDLTSYSTPTFSMWLGSDGSQKVNDQVATKGATIGELYYNPAAGDIDTAGIYGGKFKIYDGNGKKVSIPEDGLIKIIINSPTQS